MVYIQMWFVVVHVIGVVLVCCFSDMDQLDLSGRINKFDR